MGDDQQEQTVGQGRVPFGYRGEGGTLVIDPEQAELVRDAALRVLAGETLYRIRADWNERGIPTADGNTWNDRGIKLILRNPSLKGVREYRPVLPDGTRAKTSQLSAKAVWAPILDEDTWQQVGEVLEARKKARNFHQPGSGASTPVPVLGTDPMLEVWTGDGPPWRGLPMRPGSAWWLY